MSDVATQPKYYRPGDPLDRIVPFLCPTCGGINDARQYALLRLAATIPLMLPFKQCQCPSREEVSESKNTEDEELARTLLSLVARNRKDLRVVSRDAISGLFSQLLDDLEELCKRHVSPTCRAIFTLGLEYGEGKYYSEADRTCGNFVRVLDARERALQEAAMRLFSESEHQLYSFRYCATEQLPNSFARKYIWRDIRPQHIEWLRKAKDAGFIDSLIIDYDPEQEAQKL